MKDLLDLRKPIERYDLRQESLQQICRSVIDIWKHSEYSKSHTVKFLQPEDQGDIVVLAESQRLHQVFLNLLENAAQHSPEGGVIKLVINKPEGLVSSVHVIDRGSGVPKEILSRVFEPFFSTRRGGTGLGLSIVRNIVENHGGSIEILNNEHAPGCNVEVRLPIADSGMSS
jgi:signal transduction histidine kinase